MDDERAAEGVEHLQSAARELLAAARSFLDVVEEVVDDRDRLTGAAASVVDLVRDGVATVTASRAPLEPWETAAWGGTPADGGMDEDTCAPDDLRDAEPDPSPAPSSPVRTTAGSPRPPARRRVTRIAVD